MFELSIGERLQSVVKLNSLIFSISNLLLLLRSVIITCYTVSSLEMHKKIHVCPPRKLDSKSEHWCCGTAELSNSSGQDATLQSVLDTTSPGGHLLSQCHFTWLTTHPGGVMWITGTCKTDMQGFFTEWKGAIPESECGPAFYFSIITELYLGRQKWTQYKNLSRAQRTRVLYDYLDLKFPCVVV